MRKWIIAGITFLMLFSFVPSLKCEDQADTKDSICELYGACKVDIYYPAALIIFTGCPYQDVSAARLSAITGIFILFSVGAGYGINFLYIKYRDI